MSICYYSAWVLFPRWPGNCQVSSRTRAIQFSTFIFLKGRKLANKKKCQQSSKPPCHLRAQSCKTSIFPVKGWVLSCFVKLFLTAGRASAAHRAAFLQRKGGLPLLIYRGLSTLVQIFSFKPMHTLSCRVPLTHSFFCTKLSPIKLHYLQIVFRLLSCLETTLRAGLLCLQRANMGVLKS